MARDDVKEAPPGGELATLFPAAREVKVAGKKVTVRTLNIVEIAGLLPHIEELIAAWDATTPGLRVVANHPNAVVALAAAATNIDADALAAAPAADFLRVAVKALEANADFFVVAADLILGPTGARLLAIIGGNGRTSSSTSPDTGSTTP